MKKKKKASKSGKSGKSGNPVSELSPAWSGFGWDGFPTESGKLVFYPSSIRRLGFPFMPRPQEWIEIGLND